MTKTLLCTAALTAALAGSAWAQASPSAHDRDGAAPMGSTMAPRTTPHGGPEAFAGRPVIGDPVVDRDGKPVGVLQDVVLGRNGKVANVIVNVTAEGTRQRNRYVAVAWNHVSIDPRTAVATLTYSLAQVEDGPGYHPAVRYPNHGVNDQGGMYQNPGQKGSR